MQPDSLGTLSGTSATTRGGSAAKSRLIAWFLGKCASVHPVFQFIAHDHLMWLAPRDVNWGQAHDETFDCLDARLRPLAQDLAGLDSRCKLGKYHDACELARKTCMHHLFSRLNVKDNRAFTQQSVDCSCCLPRHT
jgi:hypothetical protein